MQQLIVATKNNKKLNELKKLLKNLPLRITDLNSVNRKAPNIIEDKKTFIGNAKKKALTISRIFKNMIVIADDSGLCVDYLNGAPGIHSARYAGEGQNNKKNIDKLLKAMENSSSNKKAFFVCAIAIAKNGKLIATTEAKVHGVITSKKSGKSGFGYDPVFIPKGYKKTFAKMKPGFKNRISHRAKALKQAKFIIQKYLLKYS